MCDACETSLRAMDAVLGTLIVARENVLRQLAQEQADAGPVAEPVGPVPDEVTGCTHPETGLVQVRDGWFCPGCEQVI